MTKVEDLLYRFRWQIGFLIFGLILIGCGILLFKTLPFGNTEIEVLNNDEINGDTKKELTVEVAGSVEKPGVYTFSSGSRVEEAIIEAGGLSGDADRDWVEKTLNRASLLTDGQKIYIPSVSDNQSDNLSAKSNGGYLGQDSSVQGSFSQLININTASQKDLESLWGIGPVTAQSIIEQRPYSTVEELLIKKILKQNVYDRNKDKLTVY
jgi:competence protein ComEA